MGVLIGVGIGPGDPELLTARAMRVLREADRVLAPATAVDAVGRAESVVRQACPDVTVERLAFDMSTNAARAEAPGPAVGRVVECLDAGETVAFITLGDPNIYSTFASLAEAVTQARLHTTVETVPGIMAFQDLAARSGTTLLRGVERMALVTALDGPTAMVDALDNPEQAVVVYKGGRHLPALAKCLADSGRLDGAVAGELLGLPGERVAAAGDMAGGPAAYLMTLIVPPASRLDEPQS